MSSSKTSSATCVFLLISYFSCLYFFARRRPRVRPAFSVRSENFPTIRNKLYCLDLLYHESVTLSIVFSIIFFEILRESFGRSHADYIINIISRRLAAAQRKSLHGALRFFAHSCPSGEAAKGEKRAKRKRKGVRPSFSAEKKLVFFPRTRYNVGVLRPHFRLRGAKRRGRGGIFAFSGV